MLRESNLLFGLFAQNSETTMLYEKNCLLKDIYVFITSFFVGLSILTIAIAGIDRYQKIKYSANFKSLWPKKAVIEFISVDVFLAFLQTMMFTIPWQFNNQRNNIPSKSNNASTKCCISASRNTKKKNTKLNVKIKWLWKIFSWLFHSNLFHSSLYEFLHERCFIVNDKRESKKICEKRGTKMVTIVVNRHFL